MRSQFQAAANDINTIYGLINAYPVLSQKPSNVYISSTGQMTRSAFGIPISMTKIWSITAHDDVSEFYTTPLYYPNFVSTAYSGPAIIFQGWDWYIYAVNAVTGALLTGFPVATSGPCYGRCQASNIDTGGYAGMTMIYAATHGGMTGAGFTGQIIALHSDGTSAWAKENVYVNEGGNDGHASVSLGTVTTLSAAITTVGQTAISVTSGANIANGNQIMIGIEVLLVTAGGGTTALTVQRGYNGTTAATHIIGTTVNTGFPTVGGTLTTGLSVTSATNSSVSITPNPSWATTAWTRVEGLGFGALAMIVSGTGSGQQREITGVTGGGTLTISGTWAVNPDNTSKVQILPRYQSDLYYQHAGTLSVEGGTTYLYSASFDCTLVKRNAVTGATVWRYWTGENIEPFPLVAPVTDTVTTSILVNSIDGYTHCVNTSGALVWKTQGTANIGLDSYISAANVQNNANFLNVVINQRRSGSAQAGRCFMLRGDTGAKVAVSQDQLGDNSSQPLLVPRNDGSNKYWIFSVGNACIASLYDDAFNALWSHRYSDASGLDQFRSSPFLADVNYDGVNEIVGCMQNTGTIVVWSLGGTELAQIRIPGRIKGDGITFSPDGGIEGTPCTFTSNGLLYAIIPSKDGSIACWQFNQNAG
jgi:hypothetical protein